MVDLVQDINDDLSYLDEIQDLSTPAPPQRSAAQAPKRQDSSPKKWGLGFGRSNSNAKPIHAPASLDEAQPFSLDDDNDNPPAHKLPAATSKAKDSKAGGAAALFAQLERKTANNGQPVQRSSSSSRSLGSARPSGGGIGAYNSQGTHPPVLSDVKIEFVKRRWLQTLLGGPKVQLAEGWPKWYLLLMQGVVWILPIIIGVVLSMFHCPFSSSPLSPSSLSSAVCPQSAFSSPVVAPAIAGGIMFFFYAVMHTVSTFRRRNWSRAGRGGKEGVLAMIADEDDADFDGPFTAEAMDFVLPGRSWAGVLFGFLSAAFMGLAVHYLSPVKTYYALGGQALLGFQSDAPTAVYAAFGWIVIGMAAYALNARAPPELNRYHGRELPHGLDTHTSRVLHACIIMAIASGVQDGPAPRAVLLVLPVMWASGAIPQVDVGIEYAFEQALVHLHGGPYAASQLRLVYMTLLAWLNVCVCILVETYGGTHAYLSLSCAALLGFILSCDVVPAAGERPTAVHRRWAGSYLEAMSSVVVCVGLFIIPILLKASNVKSLQPGAVMDETALLVLDAVILALCVVTHVSSWLQRPYIAGLVANPLYKLACSRASRKGKKATLKTSTLLYSLSACYRGARLLGSLAIAVYVLFFAYFNASFLAAALTSMSSLNVAGSFIGMTDGVRVFRTILITRALRKCWQNPTASLLEVSIAAWIMRGTHSGSIGWFSVYGPTLQWLIVGVCLSRAGEARRKMSFAWILSVTSWIDEKQRAKLAGSVLVLLGVTFPIFLCVVLAASALSSPLLPMLGVPIFIIGFPRPKRHWPLESKVYTGALEAAYYQQATPALIMSISSAVFSGSLGAQVCGGEFFLMRRDTLLLMAQVLEVGRNYVMFLVKGMELQETSCHHVEAGAVESVMDSALGDCSEAGTVPLLPALNPHVMHTLEPLLHIHAQAYSVADTQLTGVIDRPENAHDLPRYFAAALLWLLRRRIRGLDGGLPHSWLDMSKLQDLGYSAAACKGSSAFPAAWANYIDLYRRDVTVPAAPEPGRKKSSKAAHAGSNRVAPEAPAQDLDDLLHTINSPRDQQQHTKGRRSTQGNPDALLEVISEHTEGRIESALSNVASDEEGQASASTSQRGRSRRANSVPCASSPESNEDTALMSMSIEGLNRPTTQHGANNGNPSTQIQARAPVKTSGKAWESASPRLDEDKDSLSEMHPSVPPTPLIRTDSSLQEEKRAMTAPYQHEVAGSPFMRSLEFKRPISQHTDLQDAKSASRDAPTLQSQNFAIQTFQPSLPSVTSSSKLQPPPQPGSGPGDESVIFEKGSYQKDLEPRGLGPPLVRVGSDRNVPDYLLSDPDEFSTRVPRGRVAAGRPTNSNGLGPEPVARNDLGELKLPKKESKRDLAAELGLGPQDEDDLDDLLNEFDVSGGNFGVGIAGGNFGGGADDTDDLLTELEELVSEPSTSKEQNKGGATPRQTSTVPASNAVVSATAASTERDHVVVIVSNENGVDQGVRVSNVPHVTTSASMVTSMDEQELQRKCHNWMSVCYSIVEEWGLSTSSNGAEHVTKMYAGTLPYSSVESEWLVDKQGLRELICKAYRYAFKLAYDSLIYGDTGDELGDMQQAFEDYDKSWCLGPEGSALWADAVRRDTPSLLAVWGDKGVYRSRALTLVDGTFQAGRLNGEAVRGLWSAMSMELYYFTNDDDERYSIQANTRLLRNLMVQSAHPPLGYALYSAVETSYS